MSSPSLLSRLRLPAVPPQRRPADLVYAANERPPAGALLGLGLQHAATALALIAYVLVAAHMAQLPVAVTNSLVTATVLGMALATLLQAWGARTGAGALIVHIPDPVIFITAAAILVHYGPGGLAAAGLVNGLVGLFVAQVLPRLRALFPPTVAGVVICLTGLSLVTPALEHSTGLGKGGALDLQAVTITAVALAVVVGFSVWGSRRMKLFALLAGLAAGVVMAGLAGRLEGGALLAEAPLFALPALTVPVFDVDLGLLLAVALLSLMVQLDTLGTVILMNKMDDADWRRADMARVGRGLRAGSLSAIATGFLGGLPSSTSSANIALCHISRSTSRYVGLATAGLLALVAFMPKGTLALTLIPTPVIGAVEIYAAAYLIVSGVELIASRALDSRAIFMVGLSVVAGMGVILLPALPREAPQALQFVVGNGVILGGILAIVLNMLFRLGTSRRARSRRCPRPVPTIRIRPPTRPPPSCSSSSTRARSGARAAMPCSAPRPPRSKAPRPSSRPAGASCCRCAAASTSSTSTWSCCTAGRRCRWAARASIPRSCSTPTTPTSTPRSTRRWPACRRRCCGGWPTGSPPASATGNRSCACISIIEARAARIASGGRHRRAGPVQCCARNRVHR
ncbi:uracil-xanthine permease family protein [Bordetella genomosp. 1]|uniref:uracil-xanthine permease family protein n=1 Tax=Bordetella genomosp. 1 TaxID=1395607 RepID=UPI0015959226|nr:solute carrier family 23 protein [Bordetella genomosp. 1]